MAQNYLNKKKMVDKMFQNALIKNKVKAKKYVEPLTKTDINAAIKQVKQEMKLQQIKTFIKGLLVQYDNSWDLVEEIIMDAFEEMKGGKKDV